MCSLFLIFNKIMLYLNTQKLTKMMAVQLTAAMIAFSAKRIQNNKYKTEYLDLELRKNYG